jgi:hypothetical protein
LLKVWIACVHDRNPCSQLDFSADYDSNSVQKFPPRYVKYAAGGGLLLAWIHHRLRGDLPAIGSASMASLFILPVCSIIVGGVTAWLFWMRRHPR